jgi:hypothetical protein
MRDFDVANEQLPRRVSRARSQTHEPSLLLTEAAKPGVVNADA